MKSLDKAAFKTTLNCFKMHSIYAIVSAKKKTTYARVLRDLMSSEKNKKIVVQKLPLQVVQKKSASQLKKSCADVKGLNSGDSLVKKIVFDLLCQDSNSVLAEIEDHNKTHKVVLMESIVFSFITIKYVQNLKSRGQLHDQAQKKLSL